MMSASNRLVRPRLHSANLSTLRVLRSLIADRHAPATTTPNVTNAPAAKSRPRKASKSLTTLQEANPRNLPEVWFSATFPLGNTSPAPRHGDAGSDERKVKLGKTLRILQERLPTLLQSPLPQEILAPNISLHLFPSTHPHLPVVSGRVAYIAALWTSPIAWNRVPIVGNVKLEILSERMVNQTVLSPAAQQRRRHGAVGEQLVVRWRTIGGKTKGWGGLPFGLDGGKAATGPSRSMQDGEDFTGLFIFDFDGEGRIVSHTIETVQEGGSWERGVGAKVVELTDRLLGGIKGGRGSQEGPCPAFHVPDSRWGR